MPEYHTIFLKGEEVRIADRDRLEESRKTWRFHHPLREHQLAYAGGTARAEEVSFFHGGDCLYELRGIAGIWHEPCLVDPTLAFSPLAASRSWLKEVFRNRQTWVAVIDLRGSVCYEAPADLYRGTLENMSAVLRIRSASGFATRYGFVDQSV